ncbi:MAG TPA: hypothetical protein VNA16_06140, partial [Abditibacteriaceae bacterium]|nr:hypothetical protein [Abditibacteriaceae bacterium]
AYLTNVDRTARNTNLLVWHRELWLIDHGAALYFHHDWDNYLERSRRPFAQINDHVLLPFAAALDVADEKCVAVLTPEVLSAIIALIPEDWLGDVAQFPNVEAHRAAYITYLLKRLEAPRAFSEETRHARTLHV